MPDKPPTSEFETSPEFKKEGATPETPQPPLPPLPQHYEFPYQLLDSWYGMQPGAYVDVRLTQRDFDRLFWGLTKTIQALDQTNQALVDWSNGRAADADLDLYNSKRLLLEANNEIRQFFAAVMVSATTGVKPSE
jgi:hypothetical protein